MGLGLFIIYERISTSQFADITGKDNFNSLFKVYVEKMRCLKQFFSQVHVAEYICLSPNFASQSVDVELLIAWLALHYFMYTGYPPIFLQLMVELGEHVHFKDSVECTAPIFEDDNMWNYLVGNMGQL